MGGSVYFKPHLMVRDFGLGLEPVPALLDIDISLVGLRSDPKMEK